MHGDLRAPKPNSLQAAHHAEKLGFPQGPYTIGYAKMLEIGVRIEAGQLDRAAVRPPT